jgi:tetratricopeptide (TPR) repeat protein
MIFTRAHELATVLTPMILVIACISCAQTNRDEVIPLSIPSFDGEAISLLSDTLRRPSLDEQAYHERDSSLQEAYIHFRQDSTNLENIIWLGRRLAYLHRYKEAIAVFSNGMLLYPEAPELYRHRGHRLITIRRLDDAISDLRHGIELSQNLPLAKEPDGIPNALNIPLSNLQFNLHYHLGLAYYLRGDYDDAMKAYNDCLTYSDNPDLKVATLDWLYLSMVRKGDTARARVLLNDIHPHLEIIENKDYLQRLLLYKGMIDPAALMQVDAHSPAYVNRAYGLTCWLEQQGQPEVAAGLRKEILSSDLWPAFSYIAAEADSARQMVNHPVAPK